MAYLIMPTFYPRLSQSIHIPIGSTKQDKPFIHLSFFATFHGDEDQTGSWEIWTDLPLLNERGERENAIGEWRTIKLSPPIEEVQSNSTVDDIDQVTPLIDLTYSASKSIEAEIPWPTITASIAVPAIPEVYAYTFRHILPSGDIQWLGAEGSNGVISIIEEMASTEKTKSEVTFSHDQDHRWEGFAVGLNLKDG